MDSRVSLPTVDCGMQDGLTLPTCVRETIYNQIVTIWLYMGFDGIAVVCPSGPKRVVPVNVRVSCHIAGHHRQYTLSSRGPVVNLGYCKELLLSTTLVIVHPSNRATGLIGELLTSNCCQWTYIEVRAH